MGRMETMKISFRLMLAGVIVVGLAVGAGIGAFQAGSNGTVPVTVASAGNFSASASGQAGVAGPSQQQGGSPSAGQGTSSRPTMGVVERVGAQEFSVKEEGSSNATTVRVNDKTAFRKQGTGAISDIKKGDRIVARGEAGEDGVVKAASIQIISAEGGSAPVVMQPGSPGGQQRQGNFSGGANGAGRGQGSGFVMGTVESVEGNTVVVTPQGGMPGQSSSQSGPIKVSVADDASITKTVDGSLEDVKEGTSVLVVGPRGADGVVVASSVQILPEGGALMIRRGR